MKFRECPECGAALDPGEKCDCQNEKESVPAATGTLSGGNDCRRESTCILADPYQDVKLLLRLKEIRESTGAMAKDVAITIRGHFPQFNRQLLSQCEHWENTGVICHPDVLRIICETLGGKLPNIPDDPVEIKEEDPTPKKKRRTASWTADLHCERLLPSIPGSRGSSKRKASSPCRTGSMPCWTICLEVRTMVDIPDHPEIACALATGYPHPVKEYFVNCEDCGDELTGMDRPDCHVLYVGNLVRPVSEHPAHRIADRQTDPPPVPV